jgi:arabinan endo-1,5-alpha-L-arabinosidase
MHRFWSAPTRIAAAATVLVIGTAVGLAALTTQRHAVTTRQVFQALGQTVGTSPDYTNPVINSNFPDPSILSDRGTYYAYATNSGPTMPCAKSTDLVHWTALPDAMPKLPSWVKPGRTWAPEVRAYTPGRRYVAYFCAHAAADDTQAVGVAVSDSPTGPFTSPRDTPLVDQPDLGGAIDPSCFVDSDGSHWLVWKNDGNSRGLDTWLWVQKLSPDGTQLVGAPTKMIKQDQKWEGNLVEAPTLWRHGGKYYLFYSANGYGGCGYAIGYAVAPAITGPYVKPRSVPFVASTGDVCGPGGEDIVTAGDGTTWMSYHYWGGGRATYRCMSIDPLIWDRDVPYLLGPSRWPQPAPAR